MFTVLHETVLHFTVLYNTLLYYNLLLSGQNMKSYFVEMKIVKFVKSI